MKTQAVIRKTGKRCEVFVEARCVPNIKSSAAIPLERCSKYQSRPAGCPGNSTPLQYSEQQASKETLLPVSTPSSRFLSISQVWPKIWSTEEALDGLLICPRLSADELSPAGRTFTTNFTLYCGSYLSHIYRPEYHGELWMESFDLSQQITTP